MVAVISLVCNIDYINEYNHLLLVAVYLLEKSHNVFLDLGCFFSILYSV